MWGPGTRRWSYRAVFAASIVVAVLAYGIPLWYHVHGQRILVVTSGSMAPTFNTGDAVIIEPISPSELRAGQVVTFWPIDHSGPLTTHRIVGLVEVTDFDGPDSEVPIRDSNGDIQKSQFIRTQGDANKSLRRQPDACGQRPRDRRGRQARAGATPSGTPTRPSADC